MGGIWVLVAQVYLLHLRLLEVSKITEVSVIIDPMYVFILISISVVSSPFVSADVI